MDNFNVEKIATGNFVVKANSERFGEQAIMFQGINRAECLDYIEKHREPQKPIKGYYVISDLEKLGKGAKFERFTNLEVACGKFKAVKGKITETGEKAHATLGMTLHDLSEIDIIHERGGINLCTDFARISDYNTRKDVLEAINKICQYVQIDTVRDFKKEGKSYVPVDTPFTQWENDYGISTQQVQKLDIKPRQPVSDYKDTNERIVKTNTTSKQVEKATKHLNKESR